MQRFDRTPQRSWLWLLTVIAASWALPATAQVVPDTTLGRGNNTVTITNGDRTDILGGLRRNSSLFQSFERFSIDTNQQVYFANPSGIRNIFSRVTGGSLSNINGLLGVAGSANLFFMNPNGIIFGPNARLDVSGSFLATTANALEFADNQKFAATGDRAVPLVEVNIPIGLQYGTNPPAMLTNRGNLAAGKDLTLAAGNLDLQGQVQAGGNLTLQAQDTVKIRDTVNEPFVARSGGDMVIQGDRGVDILALNHPTTTPFVSGRNLSLVSDGIISGDAHFNSGGNFSIRNLSGTPGNFFSLYDPIIRSAGDVEFGEYSGASLKVEAAGSISATGNITITQPDATPNPASDPESAILSGGHALILRAGSLVAASFNLPSNQPDTPTSFVPQPITSPGSVTVSGWIKTSDKDRTDPDPVILSATGPITVSKVDGNNISIAGGSVEINTTGALTVEGTVSVRRDGDQRAGNIVIGDIQPNSISLPRQPSAIKVGGLSTRNLASSNNGGGGNITVKTTGSFETTDAFDANTENGQFKVPDLTQNPENIVSIASASRAGQSGNISIIAGGSIKLSAGISSASNFNMQGGSIELRGNATPVELGNPSAVTIPSPLFAIDTTRGVITSRNDGVSVGPQLIDGIAFTADPGTAGDVTLTATTGDIHSGSINAFSEISNASANQRSSLFSTIRINSEGSVFVENNRQIVATNSGFDSTGNTVALGGDVIINAGEKVRIANTSIQSQGDYGRILIGGALGGTGATQNIEIDNSNLKTDSFQQPNAGAIMLNAQKIISILGGSQITSKAAYQGTQKNKNSNPDRIADITVTGGAVDITNSLIDASTSGTTQGGNVVIAARNGGIVTLLGDQNPAVSAIKATTTGRGDGGSIIVAGKTITSTGYSANTSSSSDGTGNAGTGNAGSITFGKPENNITLPDTITVLAPIEVDTINLTDSNLTTSAIGQDGSNSNSGDIKISANQAITTTGGSFTTVAGTSGKPNVNPTGKAGRVDVNSGGLSLDAILLTDTRIDAVAYGSGAKTGGVTIQATDGSITLKGNQVSPTSISTTTYGSQATEDINIITGGTIKRGGTITLNNYKLDATVAEGSGNGGNITLKSNGGIINLDGDNKLGGIATTVQNRALGSGGDITIASNGGQINFNNGFQVNAQTQATNTIGSAQTNGIGGNVSIASGTGDIALVGNSKVIAGTTGTKNSGNIDLMGRSISLAGSQIQAQSTGTGSAGNVVVTGAGISLTGGASRSVISTSATGANANAGDATLSAIGHALTLQNSDVIASSAQGTSGNVSITARQVDLKNGTIKAETGQNIPGSKTGSITLDASFRLTLEDESTISTEGKGGARGGDITIKNVRFLLGKPPTGLNGSDIVGRANDGGQGGKVILGRSTLVKGFRFGKAVLGNRTNDIDTNGQLDNFSTDADVGTRGLATPPLAFTDVSQLTASACDSVGAKATASSELRLTGRGGVTLSPTAPLPALPTASDWVSLDLTPQVPTTVTFANGEAVTLQPGQTYQIHATCVKSWKAQQRSLL